jgi:hypothetical protein
MYCTASMKLPFPRNNLITRMIFPPVMSEWQSRNHEMSLIIPAPKVPFARIPLGAW